MDKQLIKKYYNETDVSNLVKKFVLSRRFKIIHIHANNFGSIDKNSNPNVLEFTFINQTKFKTSNLKSNIEYDFWKNSFSNRSWRKYRQ